MRLHRSLLLAAALASVTPAFAADFAWKGNGTSTPTGGSGTWDALTPWWENGVISSIAGTTTTTTTGPGVPSGALGTDPWPGTVTTTVTSGTSADSVWTPANPGATTTGALVGRFFFGGAGGDVIVSNNISLTGAKIFAEDGATYNFYSGSKSNPGILTGGNYVAATGNLRLVNVAGTVAAESRAKSTTTVVDTILDLGQNGYSTSKIENFINLHHRNSRTYNAATGVTTTTSTTFKESEYIDLSTYDPDTGEYKFDYTYGALTTTTTKVTGGVDNPRQRIVLDTRDSATLTGALTGEGILVKEGSGTLQINSSMAGFNGVLEVNGGELRVAGSLASQSVGLAGLSTWFSSGLEIIRGGNPLLGSWGEARYTLVDEYWVTDLVARDQGAVSTVLRNNARLSFQNTQPNFAQEPGGPFLFRVNGVRNLVSDINTELQTGLDANYRISLESQTGFDSSIGILSGQGRFYKTGSGSLTIRNDSTFTGDILLAGGVTTLASSGGKSLFSANSINLANVNAGGGATRGNATVPVIALSELSLVRTNVGIAPWTAPVLRLEGDQTIHNLQTKFFETQASMGGDSGAAAANKWEPLIAGTGLGTRIELGSSSLTIVQDADGWYQGDIIGGTGSTLIKAGAATLVLDGTTSSFETLRITGGKLVTNVQSLGTGIIDLSAGGLQIYQSNAATLNALLKSSRGTITEVGSSATINNGSVVNIGGGDAGVIKIKRFQQDFLGSIRIGDGVNLQLAAEGGSTLGNAESVIFVNNVKSDGTTLDRVTTISFNDTDQILPTLVDTTVGSSTVAPTRSFARIDLGKGSITLRQASAGSFAGDITGTGSLLKSGADFTLLGNASYSGATVVQTGALAVTVENGVRNTSALVLGAGAVFEAAGQSQQVGALFGGAGSVVNMGGGTLTVGMAASREAAAIAEGDADPASNTFLATGPTSSSAVNAARTVAFLQNKAGLTADEAASLAFAGDIRGSGDLIKRGSQRLILSGVNSFTGAAVVNEGVLQINTDSLANASRVEVSAGAALAVNAAAGTDLTFSRTITGAGDFEKVGAGRITLSSPLGLTGSIYAAAGTLTLADSGTFTGNVVVGRSRDGLTEDSGAVLEFVQKSDVTFTGSLSGPGTLVKSGAGVLTFTGSGGAFTGDVDVRAGELALAGSTPLPSGDITVASGAKLSASVSGNPVYSGTLSGAGTVAVRDGILTVNTPSSTFTGVLSMSNGTVRAGADNIYPNATIDLLAGSTFALNGTTQSLSGISGYADTTVSLDAGLLIVQTPSGVTTYDGVFSGNGQIEKSGAGTWCLRTTIDTGWTGSVTVNEGVLMATPQALAAALITVNLGSNSAAPGTLALLNEDPVNAVTFSNAIAGDGVIGKSGVGVVSLTNDSVNFAGSVSVTQGELRVETGTLGGSAFPLVSVSKDAVYTVVMNSDLTHDSSIVDSRVIGDGSLAVEGVHTLSLVNGQSYTGNTILRSGATLNATSLSTLNGLSGEVGTTVITGAALTIDQNTAGTFAGQFANTVNLTVTGTEKLKLDDLQNINGLAVSGGNLVLAADAGHAVSLTNGGTLYFDTTGALQFYSGDVTGSGNLIKTGLGDLPENGVLSNLTNLSNFTGTLGVDQGRLKISLPALPSKVTGLSAYRDGTLELNTTGTNIMSQRVSGDGVLEKTGTGLLKINDTAGSDAWLKNFTGTFAINEGTLGGTFATSGDLTVASGATIAPGNSPGTITVNGDFTNSGTLDLEITASGVSDKIVVNGVATLAAGTVFNITQFGTGVIPRGTAYTVITATDAVQAAEGDFTLSPGSRRVLIVTPSRNADINSPLFGLGSDKSVTLYDVSALQGSYAAHEGVSGMLDVLDTFTVNSVGLPDNLLGAKLALTNGAALDKTVNNLSPLGFGSMYAMSRDTALRHEDRLKERLEQRRYDNGGMSTSEWEAFVVGSAAMAVNDTARDTPTFNYNTYGGMVGLDKKLEGGPVLGGAVGYDNGTATLHQDGGKVQMNRVRGTAFLSSMVTKAWFVDGGLSAGFGDFTTKRDTVLGLATGSTTSFDLGANVVTGTVLVLQKDLHMTPYAGVSYAHHEYEGFTESGDAALKVDGWSNDSMRATVGTGLGWFVPAGDWKWKLGVDVAYNHELLDTESNIKARFKNQGGDKFSTKAAALPGDSISMGPNATLSFDDDTSVSAGLTFEYGFDGRTYNNFNVTFRRRF